MTRIRPHFIGLAFGTFLAAWHTMWALLVLIGAAQPLLDFIFTLHMITPVYHVGEFNFGIAVALIAVTGAVGYIGGWIFGLVWNWVAGRSGHAKLARA